MSAKKHRRSMGIGYKTLLSHILLAVLAVLLSSLLVFQFMYQYLKQERQQGLLSRGRYLSESIRISSEDAAIPDGETIRTYERLADAKIFLLDKKDGTIGVWHYRNLPGGDMEPEPRYHELRNPLDLDYAEKLLSGETVQATRQFEMMDEEFIVVGVPLYRQDGTICGGLIFAQPLREFVDFYKKIGLTVFAVGVISILLACVLSLRLSKRLVRPIEEITGAAMRMADGTYHEQVKNLPDNEIGNLGRALNTMSSRLIDVISNLKQERDKLGMVISSIGEGLVAIDDDWNIVHANAVFLELTEMGSVDALKESQVQGMAELRKLLADCLESGRRLERDWRNPSQRDVHAVASGICGEDEAIIGVVCLMRDVSEYQRMEQLRRDYVANISHELRTPLTGIRGMVEPLIDGCMDTEEERQASYAVILKETIRLQKLVGDMLDISRLQDGRASVETEALELSGIMKACVRSMKPLAEKSGVILTLDMKDAPLMCMGNEDRITQVLVILIDNALSFTPSAGTVTVFARDAGDCVMAGVRDTGCGIAPRDLPMIWDRFYKADRSRMRTKGTGLGLTIAKRVVELMDGTIDVESTPGQGSVFTFTLKKPCS